MRACLGLLLSLSGAAASIDYAAVLVPLWNQTDANGDGVLSLTEVRTCPTLLFDWWIPMQCTS